MPTQRGDGKLVFQVIYWGLAGSGISTQFQWFCEKQPAKEGHFALVPDGTSADAHMEFTPGKKISNVVCYAYEVSTRVGSEPKIPPSLRAPDGIVFVWDSTALAENISSLKQLFQTFGPRILANKEDITVNSLPLVIVANKRDAPNPTPITKIQEVLEVGKFGKYLIYETIALDGANVFRAFTYAMRESILKHFMRLQANKETPEVRVDLNRYQEIFQEIQDKCAAHDFAGARVRLGIAGDWDKTVPLSSLDLQRVLPELSTWEPIILRGEKSSKVWNVTRELAKKYPRVHIIELVKHVGLPQPETLELLLELIAQKKVPAKYDPESEGIDLQLYMEELDELRKSFDEWGTPRQGKKV